MDGLKTLRSTFGAELEAWWPGEPSAPGIASPIVLLPGWGAATSRLAPLEQRLRRDLCRPVVRLHLRYSRSGIPEIADALAPRIEQVALVHGSRRVDVVAHSMGGLVGALLLKRVDRAGLLRHVVTLGTPFHGAPLAGALGRVLGRFSPPLHQIIPGSALLDALQRRPVPDGARLTSVAGLKDLIVPAPCARLPSRRGHRNVTISDADHRSLILGGPAHDVVARLLRSARQRGASRRGPRVASRWILPSAAASPAADAREVNAAP